MNKRPPKYPLRFFRWFCHPDYVEDIEGDLLERFEKRTNGNKAAKWLFTQDVMRLFRPGIIKNFEETQQLNQYGMVKNYFKTTIRNLRRQPLYAAVNIGGLSASITCLILIISYIKHEYSYDQFLPNADRIYRVYNHQPGNYLVDGDTYAVTPLQLASTMSSEFSEVDAATAFTNFNGLLGKSEESLYWQKGVFSDRSFLDVFRYTFLDGDVETALDDPSSIVITRSLAKKLFNEINPVGQQLMQGDQLCQVTGVINDPPITSSIQFDFVVNVEGRDWYKERMQRERWRSNGYYTFFSIGKGIDVTQLENKMPGLLEKYWIDTEKYPQNYRFESLANIHLQTDLNFDVGLKGDKAQLRLFSIIAGIILLLAAVNYTNLAIARSISRFKEVGLRKTIGASRSQLIFQFLLESVTLTFLALLVACFLAWGIAPVFSQLLDRQLYFDTDLFLSILPALIGLMLVLGILSGYYPALIISKQKPVKALKGKSKAQGGITQKVLIVGQYAISIAMIICAMEANQQFQFMKSKDLGFQKENIITLRVRSNEVKNHYESLRNRWLSNPGILSVAGSQNLPIDIIQSTIVNDDIGGDPGDDLPVYEMSIDYDFIDLYEMEILTGRNFSRDFKDSLNVCIINETAARAAGWTPEEAIGKRFTEDWNIPYREVIGVVKDFNIHSAHFEIEPLMIVRTNPDNYRFLSFETDANNLAETIAFLDETTREFSTYPFEAQFLSDTYNELYKDELRQSQIFSFFTVLGIIIASLGLFGLTTYSIHLRIKEIGVRKVLGASVESIVSLVSVNFIKLIGLGFLIASPFAWIVIDRWLENYTYHDAIHWWVFAISGILTVLLACITMGFQILKAAHQNPAEILKDE
ncbi:ABC transporter permease [Ekhidna sp.]|uniref:ABC transporter permease n=1 Tax=Ekhidna sp. TaxID=2608089 RepID=UPI003BABFD55